MPMLRFCTPLLVLTCLAYSQESAYIKFLDCCWDCSAGGKEWNVYFEVVLNDGSQDIPCHSLLTYRAFVRLLPNGSWYEIQGSSCIFQLDGHNGTEDPLQQYEVYGTVSSGSTVLATTPTVTAPFDWGCGSARSSTTTSNGRQLLDGKHSESHQAHGEVIGSTSAKSSRPTISR